MAPPQGSHNFLTTGPSPLSWPPPAVSCVSPKQLSRSSRRRPPAPSSCFSRSWTSQADPRPGLHLRRVFIAFALRTEGSQQPGRQRRARSRQRIKNEKIGMRFRRLLDLPIKLFNPCIQNLKQGHQHLHHRHLSLHHRTILQRRHRLPDGFHSALDPLLRPTMVFMKEAPQHRRTFLLQCFQPRPALQQSAHHRTIYILKPAWYLRKIDFQVGHQAICSTLSSDPPVSASPPPSSECGAWPPYPATDGAASPDASVQCPAADRHPWDHPWPPTHKMLCAYWPSWPGHGKNMQLLVFTQQEHQRTTALLYGYCNSATAKALTHLCHPGLDRLRRMLHFSALPLLRVGLLQIPGMFLIGPIDGQKSGVGGFDGFLGVPLICC